MADREIPILPTSLIPSDVAPPPSTTPRSAPTPIPSISTKTKEDLDDVVVEGDGETLEEGMTVDLVDGDGVTVTEDYETESAPLTADMLNNTMSLRQLKDRCTELGLPTAGKKIDLAERIVASQNGETP
jgi:hypothetical protein